MNLHENRTVSLPREAAALQYRDSVWTVVSSMREELRSKREMGKLKSTNSKESRKYKEEQKFSIFILTSIIRERASASLHSKTPKRMEISDSVTNI